MGTLQLDIQKVREAYSHGYICGYRGRFTRPLGDEKGLFVSLSSKA